MRSSTKLKYKLRDEKKLPKKNIGTGIRSNNQINDNEKFKNLNEGQRPYSSPQNHPIPSPNIPLHIYIYNIHFFSQKKKLYYKKFILNILVYI